MVLLGEELAAGLRNDLLAGLINARSLELERLAVRCFFSEGHFRECGGDGHHGPMPSRAQPKARLQEAVRRAASLGADAARRPLCGGESDASRRGPRARAVTVSVLGDSVPRATCRRLCSVKRAAGAGDVLPLRGLSLSPNWVVPNARCPSGCFQVNVTGKTEEQAKVKDCEP